MHWTDDAIILSVRLHGETSAIVEVLARAQGRCMGLVRGGRSRRMRPALQPGNLVRVSWRARLEEHLGSFDIELSAGYAARAMEDKAALAAIITIGYFARLLPERDPHPELYDTILTMLQRIDEPRERAAAYARFEFLLLQELGFGLDLSECAATGATDDLIYVSPKSARAVSAQGGEPYKDKLLPLPQFLVTGDNPETPQDNADALRLTGYFLEKHVLAPNGDRLPDSRSALLAGL